MSKVQNEFGNGGGKKFAESPNFTEHLSFKTPNQHANSNFMQGINSNVMPLQNKANGTFGSGLGNQGLNQGKQPTLQSLANDYGSSTKPKVNNELTHRIGGSKIPESEPFGKDLVSQKKVQKQVDFRPEYPLTEYQVKLTDAPQNRATFERYLAERRANLTREEVLTVKDQKLWKRMNNLYRENAQVNPKSTSGAYRHEKLTGELVGGVSHDLKTKQNISGLEDWLKNTPSASSHDRSIAEQVLKDLQNAEFFK